MINVFCHFMGIPHEYFPQHYHGPFSITLVDAHFTKLHSKPHILLCTLRPTEELLPNSSYLRRVIADIL